MVSILKSPGNEAEDQFSDMLLPASFPRENTPKRMVKLPLHLIRLFKIFVTSHINITTMSALEKLITLTTALLTLSLISERVINWFKLYFGQDGNKFLLFKIDNKAFYKEPGDQTPDPVRDRKIIGLNITICIIVALLMNANVLDLLRLEDPTAHFGWQNDIWKDQSSSNHLVVNMLYSFIGCVLTGFCMSIGSKFWHDTLDMLLAIKNLRKKALENDPKGNLNQPDQVKKEQ